MDDKQTVVSSGCDLRQPGVLSAVSGLVGRIAHDFNNLITPLLAYPPLIRKDIPAESASAELLSVIEKAARDMVHITRQLQGLVMRNSPDQSWKINLNFVIKGCIENIKHEMKDKKNIEFVFQDNNSLPEIFINEDDFFIAMNNLCVNAVEAIGDKHGTIKIITGIEELKKSNPSIYGGIKEEGKYVFVRVIDNGEGIKNEFMEKIFEPCFTTRKGQKRRGAGFGLPIVYKIMCNYNGYVGVVSELGEGSQFTLYFPLKANVVKEGGISDEPVSHSVNQSHLQPFTDKTILLVDDEKGILQLFKTIINASLKDVHVDTASNGAEAVGVFSRGHHKIVVMDLSMPVMDGVQAFMEIQRICAEKKWEIPFVIFCTGFAPPETIKKLISEDKKYCLLMKPVTSDKLLEVITSRLNT